MKIVAQMDEILSININTDSTFALLLEAQNQGHEIFYYLPQELILDGKKLFASVKQITLQKTLSAHCQILNSKKTDLTNFDVILVRQDPPFNMNYITSTYLLEKIQDKILILNNPSEIRNCPEKILVTDFIDLTPKTIVTSNLEAIKEFHQQYGKIILKPLYSCAGEGIFLIKEEEPNLAVIFEILIKQYQTPIIAQKYLPAVKNGDKRVILINGEIFGAFIRLAKEGETRSNMHVGGRAVKCDLTSRDLEICQILGPHFKKRGLFLVGIDIIGDYVTEINVTSPTGIQEISFLNNIKIEKQIIEEIIKEINNFKSKKIFNL
jgi:glutathione synthase